jgi:hypothetical protein
MTPASFLSELRQRGVLLEIAGERLRCRAPQGVLTPELKEALTTHKAQLLLVLTAPPPDATGDPCPVCGSTEKWIWIDGRLLCRFCLVVGDTSWGVQKGVSGELQE